MTHTVSESLRLRRIKYVPADIAFAPTVKPNGISTSVWRSVCAKADDTVTSRVRTTNAIALSMSFIKLSFPHLTNAKGRVEAGHRCGEFFYKSIGPIGPIRLITS